MQVSGLIIILAIINISATVNVANRSPYRLELYTDVTLVLTDLPLDVLRGVAVSIAILGRLEFSSSEKHGR